MKILFRAYFHQKNFRKNLAENLLGSGSGSGQKSSGSATLLYTTADLKCENHRVYVQLISSKQIPPTAHMAILAGIFIL
jgi:hypothetical protein